MWQRPFDAQRFTHPLTGLKHGWHTEPTMDTTLRVIATEAMHALLAEARNMPAPDLNERRGITVDGTPQSLFVAGAFGEQVYSWNAIAVPQGWVNLAAGMQQATEVMDHANA